jgi:WD40 repeat protein
MMRMNRHDSRLFSFVAALHTARSEIEVLNAKVKELTEKVKALSVENQSIKAEVEIYRKEAALPSFSKLALGQQSSSNADGTTPMSVSDDVEDFIKSGNGVFPSHPEITLENLHGHANNLCCTLSPDDTVLATGGADGSLSLVSWGISLNPNISSQQVVEAYVSHNSCDAPVICVDFAKCAIMGLPKVVAAGCMDGSVHLFSARSGMQGRLETQRLLGAGSNDLLKHGRYVKSLTWSPRESLLATCSADGTIKIIQVNATASNNANYDMDDDTEPTTTATVHVAETLHLPGPVESMCFSDDGTQLFCYARGSPYLTKFDLQQGCAPTKWNLNAGTGSGAFDDHVSFCVMDMARYGSKYLALATDTSRNMVLDITTQKQVRNLYGHANDGFSNPKLAFSQNGQYIIGNTQDNGNVCVWDIASSTMVTRLEQHQQPIRDLYSSAMTDTLVTTSFDKKTTLWLTPNM